MAALNGYNGVAASLGWGRRDKSLLIFHPRITLKCDCQEQLTSTKCHSTLPSVCLSVRSAGGGSGGSESDAMDTDLGEKTVTSSTVLSGGDEVCVCACVCAYACVCVCMCACILCACVHCQCVCMFILFILGCMRTRAWPKLLYSFGVGTYACMHVLEAEWLRSPSLLAYLHD